MATETNDLRNPSEGCLKDEEFATSPQPQKLHRQLKSRHVAMISIGGVIGTGLFLKTANSLANGGPVGLLLGYITMGTIVMAVMVSLGEMIAYLPIPGGHIKLAERFVNPALSFAMGWNYWYNWAITAPTELSAAALLINQLKPNWPTAAWVSVGMIVAITINVLGAGAYGEAEFIFASIKVLTITGLIILGIIIDLGGGPHHDLIGFRCWKSPGPFVDCNGKPGKSGCFLVWLSVLQSAAFSFLGTEIVAIAAAETKNPRRNLPRAIRRVYVRILLFYILGTSVIGLLVPSNDKQLPHNSGTAASPCGDTAASPSVIANTAASPFVIAIQNAGIKYLPGIINACLLTSAWSAASSDIYTSSRALYGLSLVGSAPKIFARTSKAGLPYVSVVFCSLFTLLAFTAVSSGAGRVFDWFSTMTSVAGLLTWFGICVTYIRFYSGMKAQGINRRTLPYYSRLQPYVAWYGAIWTFLICLLGGFEVFVSYPWKPANFVTDYLPVALFPILYVGAFFYYRVPLVKPEDMDFVSDIAQIEADESPEEPPRNKVESVWRWLT